MAVRLLYVALGGGFGAASLIHTAKILSKYTGSETEKALLCLLKHSADPYIQATAIESLGTIGTDQSLRILEDISLSDSVIPREKAIKAVESIKKRNEQNK